LRRVGIHPSPNDDKRVEVTDRRPVGHRDGSAVRPHCDEVVAEDPHEVVAQPCPGGTRAGRQVLDGDAHRPDSSRTGLRRPSRYAFDARVALTPKSSGSAMRVAAVRSPQRRQSCGERHTRRRPNTDLRLIAEFGDGQPPTIELAKPNGNVEVRDRRIRGGS
jgi:hypothetical protein